MGESFDTLGTLLIEGVFQCKLKWFTLAASIVRPILMFWFQKEEEKKGADVVSNRSHDDKILTLATRSAFIACAKEAT